MKFQKFMKTMQELILKKPNMDLKTLKIILNIFYENLSPNEKKRYVEYYNIVDIQRSCQKTIDKTLSDNRIDFLENEFNILKNSISLIEKID